MRTIHSNVNVSVQEANERLTIAKESVERYTSSIEKLTRRLETESLTSQKRAELEQTRLAAGALLEQAIAERKTMQAIIRHSTPKTIAAY